MKHLLSRWSKIGKPVLLKKKLLLLLDFDGTLAPIAKTPDSVILHRKTHHVLSVLSRSRGIHLAIISGRSLGNIRSFFRLKNVLFVGNHGLEMSGVTRNLPAKAKKALRMRKRIHALVREFRRILKPVQGAFVEDKRYTLSIHYRNVPRRSKQQFDDRMRLLKRQTRKDPVFWRRGKKVWELGPAIS